MACMSVTPPTVRTVSPSENPTSVRICAAPIDDAAEYVVEFSLSPAIDPLDRIRRGPFGGPYGTPIWQCADLEARDAVKSPPTPLNGLLEPLPRQSLAYVLNGIAMRTGVETGEVLFDVALQAAGCGLAPRGWRNRLEEGQTVYYRMGVRDAAGVAANTPYTFSAVQSFTVAF